MQSVAKKVSKSMSELLNAFALSGNFNLTHPKKLLLTFEKAKKAKQDERNQTYIPFQSARIIGGDRENVHYHSAFVQSGVL